MHMLAWQKVVFFSGYPNMQRESLNRMQMRLLMHTYNFMCVKGNYGYLKLK